MTTSFAGRRHLPRGELRDILVTGGFQRLLGTRLTSQFADGLFQAGLAGNLLFNPSRHTSALAIATGFAILLLPYSILGPYVGVFLDRWDRRGTLYLANALRALLVLPTALLVWWDSTGPAFAALALVVIAANRFFLAGLSAALPRVVTDGQLVTANAVASTLGTMTYSLGLFSAAGVITTGVVGTGSHGYAAVTALAAGGYLASALIARATFARGALGPAPEERPEGRLFGAVLDVARGMINGVRHLAERRPAAYALLVQAGHRYLYGVVTLAVLLLYRGYFGADQRAAADQSAAVGGSLWGLAQVVIAGAAGAGLAALITPAATRRFGGHGWVTGLMAAMAAVVLGLGLPFRAYLLLIAAFLVNVVSQSVKIVVDSTLQHDCADAFRGRVFSINDTAFNLCFVAGLFTAAALLPPDGKSATALFAVAAGWTGLAVWYGLAIRTGRYGRGRSARALDDGRGQSART